jgi:hypothetical protein
MFENGSLNGKDVNLIFCFNGGWREPNNNVTGKIIFKVITGTRNIAGVYQER